MKQCQTCGQEFTRPRDYSARQWASRKFCGAKCVRGHLKQLGPKTRYRKVRDASGRTLSEHRLVLEKKLGRHLRPDEHAHHVNGNKEDNRPENLEARDAADHGREHALADAAYRRTNGLPMGRAIARAVRKVIGA